MAFSLGVWLFLGNHIWQPGLAQNKHKCDDFQRELRSLESLRKLDFTKMSEDFDDIISVTTVEFVDLEESSREAVEDLPTRESPVVVALEDGNNNKDKGHEVVNLSDSDSFNDESTPHTHYGVPARDSLRPLPGTSGRTVRSTTLDPVVLVTRLEDDEENEDGADPPNEAELETFHGGATSEARGYVHETRQQARKRVQTTDKRTDAWWDIFMI